MLLSITSLRAPTRRSALYTWKRTRNATSRLWREYISNDQSTYQTVVYPMMKRTLLSKRLYAKMIDCTFTVILVLTIQRVFWTQYGISLLPVTAVIFFLTTLLWSLAAYSERSEEHTS